MMQPDTSLFPKIKALVHEVVPDAQVLLFGSQANGTATEESDWDVLVLTQQKVDWGLEETLYKKVFPLSVQADTLISLLIVQEDAWRKNPAYYELRQSIAAGRIIL